MTLTVGARETVTVLAGASVHPVSLTGGDVRSLLRLGRRASARGQDDDARVALSFELARP
jgi:hypothetical protein